MNGKMPQVKFYKRIPAEEAIFDSDNNLNTELLSRYLKNEIGKIKSKDVVITFSSLSAITNDYIMTYDKNNQRMRSMIKSKIFQSLSPADYLMDYRITRIFLEDGVKKCYVIAYVMPKSLVKASFDCIVSMGKRPSKFSVAQNNIYNFSKYFLDKKTMIMIHLSSKSITAHLIDFPDHIITRTAKIVNENSLYEPEQLTAQFEGDVAELMDLTSKLVQYHSIKYPERPLESIYLMGEDANENAKEAIASANYAPVHIIDEVCLKHLSPELNSKSLIYSIGAILRNEEHTIEKFN